jgi:hypothetical protein
MLITLMPIPVRRKQNWRQSAVDGEMAGESASGGAANAGANGYNSAKNAQCMVDISGAMRWLQCPPPAAGLAVIAAATSLNHLLHHPPLTRSHAASTPFSSC